MKRNKAGQILFGPKDKCHYCGKPLGKGYEDFTFYLDIPYHCLDWGPTCKDIYEEIMADEKKTKRKADILDYLRRKGNDKNISRRSD